MFRVSDRFVRGVGLLTLLLGVALAGPVRAECGIDRIELSFDRLRAIDITGSELWQLNDRGYIAARLILGTDTAYVLVLRSTESAISYSVFDCSGVLADSAELSRSKLPLGSLYSQGGIMDVPSGVPDFDGFASLYNGSGFNASANIIRVRVFPSIMKVRVLELQRLRSPERVRFASSVSDESGQYLEIVGYQKNAARIGVEPGLLVAYEVSAINQSDPRYPLSPTSVVHTPADPRAYDSAEWRNSSEVVFKKDDRSTLVDAVSGEVVWDDCSLARVSLEREGYFWISGFTADGRRLWRYSYDFGVIVGVSTSNHGGVREVIVLSEGGFIQILSCSGRYLRSSSLNFYLQPLPGPRTRVEEFSATSEALEVYAAGHLGSRWSWGRRTDIQVDALAGPKTIQSTTVVWDHRFDGEEWPITVSSTGLGFELQAPGSVSFLSPPTEYVVDRNTGFITSPEWLARAELSEDRRSIVAYSQDGSEAWRRTPGGALFTPAIPINLVGAWARNVLIDPDDESGPQIVRFGVSGEMAPIGPLDTPGVVPGSRVRIAFAERVERWPVNFNESLEFDTIVALSDEGVGASPLLVLDLSGGFTVWGQGVFPGEIRHHGLMDNRVVVVGVRSDSSVVLEEIGRRARSGHPALFTRRFSLDGSDHLHPRVVNLSTATISTAKPELALVETASGDRFHIGEFGNPSEGALIQIQSALPASGMRTFGNEVQWIELNGSIIGKTRLDEPIVDAVLDEDGGSVLVGDSSGQSVLVFDHFKDVEPKLRKRFHLEAPPILGSSYQSFGGHGSGVLLSDGGFAYTWRNWEDGSFLQEWYGGPVDGARHVDRYGLRGDLVYRKIPSSQFAELFWFNAAEPTSVKSGALNVGPQRTVRFDGSVDRVPVNDRVSLVDMSAWNQRFDVVVRFRDGEAVALDHNWRPVVPLAYLRSDITALGLGESVDVIMAAADILSASSLGATIQYDPTALEFVSIVSAGPETEGMTVSWSAVDDSVTFVARWPHPIEELRPVSIDLLKVIFRSKPDPSLFHGSASFSMSSSAVFRRSGGSLMPESRTVAEVELDLLCGVPLPRGLGSATSMVMWILRAVTGREGFAPEQTCNFDYNLDGEISLPDAIRALRISVGLPKSGPSNSSPQALETPARWQLVEDLRPLTDGSVRLRLAGVGPVVGYDVMVGALTSSAGALVVEPLGNVLSAQARENGVHLYCVSADEQLASVEIRSSVGKVRTVIVSEGTAYLADGRQVSWPAQRLELPQSVAPSVPLVTRLEQNRPNPFNPATEIHYSLAAQGEVRLTVFDAAGREVKTLEHGVRSSGAHVATWRGDDHAGQPVASGVYWYRLRSAEGDQVRKMVLVR
jgi:FlgD Ig-like domain